MIAMSSEIEKEPLVHYEDKTERLACPFGTVQRIITGGEGGVANIHVVRITKGLPHRHAAYDEVYYVVAGTGTITLDGRCYRLRPGAVAVVPAGVVHSLEAVEGEELEFVIFGTPPLPLEDERARPVKA
jgi:mannose-6-phosphate isomerase-like protein (cupin superfamily)